MIELKIINNKAVASSKDIADIFNRNHKDVMNTIEKMSCSDEFRGGNYSASSYTSSQNKTLPSFNMTKDGFYFLCMGFTGDKAAKFKEAYIKAFNEMESTIQKRIQQAPKSMEELNRVSKQIEELKEIGSFHGKGLSGYKKQKKAADEDFKIAMDSAQLVLNIK